MLVKSQRWEEACAEVKVSVLFQERAGAAKHGEKRKDWEKEVGLGISRREGSVEGQASLSRRGSKLRAKAA